MPLNHANLLEACSSLFAQNLGVRPNEKILILTDSRLKKIGRTFLEAARNLSNQVELLEIPPGDYNGQEPPREAAQWMLECDVMVAPLAKSISWTTARRNATDRGVRIATLPGITPEILLRNFPADYALIRSRVNRFADQLDQGRTVQIRTSLGTHLVFSIAGREAHGRKGGIFDKPGFWGNLPCGEAFIAPVEGTADGVYFIDGSLPGIGRLSEPVSVSVQSG
ncbi:MAG: aminopeptidase, partial [Acidobacteriota bacterium]